LTVPARAPLGEYRLTISLYDSKFRQTPPLTAGAAATGATELQLGLLRVR
jgi:hypothetical protein